MSSLAVLILAAGQGTRMKSGRIKVLHEVCGKPMVWHVLQVASELSRETPFVVVGYQAETVKRTLGDVATYVMQAEQKGTGHAVMQAESHLSGKYDEVLVMYGDTPLLRAETLEKLVKARRESHAGCSLLSADAPDPSGYGRIVRVSGTNIVDRIVEHKDASPEELAINEINSGIYCFSTDCLFRALRLVTPKNRQGEYYLTDVVGIMQSQGTKTVVVKAPLEEGAGINDRKALAEASAVMRHRVMDRLMLSGVTIEDPQNTYIDAGARIGRDTVIRPFSFIKGSSAIGSDCEIGPGTIIEDSTVGDRVFVLSSVVERSVIEDDAHIGPYSHLRPNCVIRAGAAIGNYAEIKNSTIGEGSKVHHHSYIGDSIVGKGVNFSAGAITVNYDGEKKYLTKIEDGAFIGCNVNLVAPVKVGSRAFVAAGSTVNEEVPAEALAIARERQVNKEGWVARRRAKRAAEEQKSDK